MRGGTLVALVWVMWLITSTCGWCWKLLFAWGSLEAEVKVIRDLRRMSLGGMGEDAGGSLFGGARR